MPGLDAFVRARTAHYDHDYLSVDPAFTHAHVTVLGPFLADPGPADLATVGTIAAGVAPFDFTLERIETFPNGIIHLVPEPDGPFRLLTTRLWEAFPQCPPYAGEFPDVRPHLTLDATSPEVTEGSTRAAIATLLPMRSLANRVDLAWWAPGETRLIRSWPLG